MNITIQEDNFFEVVDDLLMMFSDHYEEICMYKDKLKLNPDFDFYIALEQAGHLLTVTARDEGKLIGYAVFTIAHHLHYKDSKIAKNDVIFLDKEYRKGSLGVKMIKHSEKILKEEGIDFVWMRTKADKSFGVMLEHIGYKPDDILFSKYIGED